MKVSFEDIGLIPYQQAWDYQELLMNKIVKQKLENEKLPEDERKVTDNWLLFCEHPHVYTLGKSGSEENLLADALQLRAKKAEFIHTNRGGDITYHGPGQIVGYPILNLIYFASGIRQYIEKLEESIILTLNEFGLNGERLDGATGVWLDTKTPGKIRKICAIGVRTSHWITMHGFAFNVNTDLSYFSMINPCGFTDKSVTSLEKELGGKQDMEKVKMLLRGKIADVFGMEFD
ncbi:MAG: lipoyl(octanoyl) transferase LipB [Bacteroidota bacterium]